MARMKIVQVVSDISGEPIPDGTGATVVARPAKGQARRLDITTDEFVRLFSNGEPIKRRGRRPRTEEPVEA